MIGYPGYHNLPEWDPVYEILEDKLDFKGRFPDCDWLEEDQIQLWWAKKNLKPEKKLADYIGKNEKTKIVVKIGMKGKHAPMAEAPIDK